MYGIRYSISILNNNKKKNFLFFSNMNIFMVVNIFSLLKKYN